MKKTKNIDLHDQKENHELKKKLKKYSENFSKEKKRNLLIDSIKQQIKKDMIKPS